MKKVKSKIATLLAGVGIIPITESNLEEILVDKNFMFTEESDDGESEGDFMKRVFDKALQNKAIVESTKQCMVINAPVGHGKMSLDEIEQISSYIDRWIIGDSLYKMNWGLYEVPNSTKMSITIVANSPVLSTTDKVEAETNTASDRSVRRMGIMCTSIIVGIASIALSIHYMKLGIVKRPICTGFVDYLRHILQQPFNCYEFYSILFWAIGGCALVYAALSINVKSKVNNKNEKNND